ncbi:MAG: AMP-binding protein [Flammeovirgaceae bacterium]|nr:AMP-binding protein [Flammeovirgaceae bacterium]
MLNWLRLNDKQFTFDELRLGQFPKSDSDFEIATLRFCNDWLSDKREFEFQSSGSTGSVRKIPFTRKQIISSIERSQKALNFKRGETALVCLDTRYVAGLMMLARCLHSGMNCIVVDPTVNPLEKLGGVTLHFAAFVPYQIQAILNSPDLELFNRIQTKIIGGAPINQNIKTKLKHLPNSIYATYGMTETLTHIALQKLNQPGRSEVFHALEGISVDSDERSCLKIRIPSFQEGEIVTNDVVELLGSNQFIWKGRFDNIINSGGIKVNPEKIESAVEKITNDLSIKMNFMAAGIDDVKLGQKIILISDAQVSDTQQKKNTGYTCFSSHSLRNAAQFYSG